MCRDLFFNILWHEYGTNCNTRDKFLSFLLVICLTTGVLTLGCLFKEELLFKETRQASQVKPKAEIKSKKCI